MKIFISHQKLDSHVATRIAQYLRVRHSIDSYLDVIDPYVGGPVEDLADHIRTEMGKCTQLLAVISPASALSQWVPWEVGVGTEKNFPLATYSEGGALPPEFLRKWPYLRSDRDLDEYAKASKSAEQSYRAGLHTFGAALALERSTKNFYRELRAALRQG